MNWIQTKTKLLRSLPTRAPYLIGVSGGRDSAALLHWLITVGYKHLIVCHLNHRLRERSSDADARFVKELATKYQTNFEIGSADVRSLAKRQKISIETAARFARYSFFADVANRRCCYTILLAHHADDLVETFLFNLIRGAGLTGLSAMREVTTRCVNNVDLTIVRPLLSIWRKEIDEYVREHRLKFHEDATNKNLAHVRNRIRHRVIPYLEKTLGRNIRQNIWRTATIAADEEKWLETGLPGSIQPDLWVAKLRALPIALQRRAILKWLRAQNISDVGFDAVERVRSLVARNAPSAKVNLPKNRHARRCAGKIFLE